jgi:hypothetical protein
VGDAVIAVKRWFHGQTEPSLVVLDSADDIDNGDNDSYLNLEFFLPDTPTVDVIITTRYARAAEMTTLSFRRYVEGCQELVWMDACCVA